MFLQKIMEMINFTYMHTLISFSLLRVRRLFEKALISTTGKTLRGIYRDSWSYFCFSSDMVLIFLVSGAVIKVGRLFVNTQISTLAIIKLLSVKVRDLYSSSDAYSSSALDRSVTVHIIMPHEWLRVGDIEITMRTSNDNETTAARLAS